MARRGPKPRPEATKKAGQMTLRLSQALRDRLQQAADSNGVTLSTEISNRLEETLDAGTATTKEFGGLQTYAVCRLIADALGGVRMQTGHSWLEDRFSYDHAITAINEIVEYFKPNGPNKVPDDLPILQQFEGRERTREKKAWATIEVGKWAAQTAIVRFQAAIEDPNNDAYAELRRPANLLRGKLDDSGKAKGRRLSTFFRNLGAKGKTNG